MHKAPAALRCRGLWSGAKGIRTPDLLIANETRYQLRHSPKVPRQVTTVKRAQKNGPTLSQARADERHNGGW